MATRTALLEEAIPLTIDGYAYSGRIVHQPDARLAPIVLVGGAFQYQNAWGRLEQGFREVASVVTVDLPGWGGADRLPARYGFDFLAEALDQLLLKVAPGPVNVLGTSYGSAVAHRWARNHPERAGRVALVGTMAHLTEAVRDRVRHTVRMAEQGKREEFVESVLEGMVCFSPRVTISRRSTVIRCLSRALHDMSAEDLVKYRENSRRLLDHAELPGGPGVRVPVLVATGEHDPLATPRAEPGGRGPVCGRPVHHAAGCRPPRPPRMPGGAGGPAGPLLLGRPPGRAGVLPPRRALPAPGQGSAARPAHPGRALTPTPGLRWPAAAGARASWFRRQSSCAPKGSWRSFMGVRVRKA
ncbi:hypothetical protein GCM10020000_08280 [Streptomyces olivoverticillatus]